MQDGKQSSGSQKDHIGIPLSATPAFMDHAGQIKQ